MIKIIYLGKGDSLMRERRKEPFRYSFDTPLQGYYNKKLNRQVAGPLRIVDMSLNGMRYRCEANPVLALEDEVFVSFILDNDTYTAEGRVIWKDINEESMTCGIHVFSFPHRLEERLFELVKERENSQIMK